MFCKNNFARFTGKHLCPFCFNKIADCRSATLLKKESQQRYFPVNSESILKKICKWMQIWKQYSTLVVNHLSTGVEYDLSKTFGIPIEKTKNFCPPRWQAFLHPQVRKQGYYYFLASCINLEKSRCTMWFGYSKN